MNHFGRPVTIGGKKLSVYLAPQHIETAKRLGDGNIAAGVRKALEKAKCQTT